MLEHFSDDEIDRMAAFTEKPSYERDPEQLLPDDADEEDGADDGRDEDVPGRGRQSDDA